MSVKRQDSGSFFENLLKAVRDKDTDGPLIPKSPGGKKVNVRITHSPTQRNEMNRALGHLCAYI